MSKFIPKTVYYTDSELQLLQEVASSYGMSVESFVYMVTFENVVPRPLNPAVNDNHAPSSH